MSLSSREKLLLIICVGIVLPLLIINFLLLPILNHQRQTRNGIANLEKNISQIEYLGKELKYYKRNQRKRTISLNKRVDSILRQTNLKSKSQTSVEDRPNKGQKLILKLNELNLTELANIVHKIEHNKPVIIINNLDISHSFKDEQLLRANLILLGL